ncbi:N-acetylmuramoyl-L-alanine amidase family protein [Rubrobacter marinus]|nr:N-acetylmuramoyl-L-alanine amidase [Rubrobacter marinus]
MQSSRSMRAWALVMFAVFVAFLLAASALDRGAEAQEAPGVLAGKKIVVDAGHGGGDAGAANARYGLVEKDQTLDVSRRLKALLEASGATVYMTRTGDGTLSNSDRYAYANRTGADILVSVHMNGSSDPAANYTTVLFGKWRKDKALAVALLDGLHPALGIPRRDPYSFASGVLLKSEMPAAIAETVFITSDAEGRLLSDGTGARQQQIAEALKTGIEGYFRTP